MFIVQVVPLFTGTDTTMSPSRHCTLCWISGSTQPGPRGPSAGGTTDSGRVGFAVLDRGLRRGMAAHYRALARFCLQRERRRYDCAPSEHGVMVRRMNSVASNGLALHEAMALLGIGDLHPGGSATTEFLLRELDRAAPRRVLEIGAGIGVTTQRLLERGWRVTAVEPNPVLRGVLEKRSAARVYAGTFETFDDAEPYDAVIAESVLYRLNLEQAFGQVRRLLRPGGLLALVDMVWTEAASPEATAALVARSERAFGIPIASADRLTWAGWRHALAAAGFTEVAAQPVGPTGGRSLRRWGMILRNGVRHPPALARYIRSRALARVPWAPPGWLESWRSVWRRI
jgi:SAM-dependent methyltransferase